MFQVILKSDYAEDSRQYTVMSYWDEYETGAHFQGAYAGPSPS